MTGIADLLRRAHPQRPMPGPSLSPVSGGLAGLMQMLQARHRAPAMGGNQPPSMAAPSMSAPQQPQVVQPPGMSTPSRPQVAAPPMSRPNQPVQMGRPSAGVPRARNPWERLP